MSVQNEERLMQVSTIALAHRANLRATKETVCVHEEKKKKNFCSEFH